MKKLSFEHLFLAYMFIALQTFGYTFYRWDHITRTSFDGTVVRTIEVGSADRLFMSSAVSLFWPVYWTVKAYEPK